MTPTSTLIASGLLAFSFSIVGTNTPKSGAVITGIVVAKGGPIAGRPVSGASVLLFDETRSSNRYETVADREGKFRFVSLRAGRYQLLAERTGFISTAFEAFRPLEMGVGLDIGETEALENLRLSLVAASNISGVIRMQSGEVAANVRVVVSRLTSTDGRRNLNVIQTRTDAAGMYRFTGLHEGDYWVGAGGDERSGSPPSTFYPGSTDATQAEAVAVKAGVDVTGIDFQLPPPGTATIDGTISTADGKAAAGLWVRLESSYGIHGQARSLADGRFTFGFLNPGRFVIATDLSDSADQASRFANQIVEWASQSVNVVAGTTSQLQLRLTRTFEVSGTISLATGPTSVEAAPSISLLRRDPLAIPVASAIRSGTIRFAGLVPGEYVLSVDSSTPCWIDQASTSGGSVAGGLRLNENSTSNITDLVIRLSCDRSDVRGLIRDSAGRPATAYWIAAVPVDRRQWHRGSPLLIRTRPAINGTYWLRQIPTTDFRLVVFHDSTGEWTDPEVLASLFAEGIPLGAQSGKTIVQDVRVR